MNPSSRLDDLVGHLETLGLRSRFNDRIDALSGFASGPPVLAVIGVRPDDRQPLAAAARRLHPGLGVVEPDPDEAVRMLWDGAIVVTPADQALSFAEQQILTAGVEADRPVAVTLSGLDGLGSDRDEALAEIVRFRLRPLLEHRRIPWSVLDEPAQPPRDLTSFLDAVALDPDRHARTADSLIDALVADAVETTAARLDERRQERQLVTSAQETVAGQAQRLRDLTRTVQLQGNEQLRVASDGLDVAVARSVDAAIGWLKADGKGPWPDTSTAISHAWSELVRCATGLVDDRSDALRTEIGATQARIAAALGPLLPADEASDPPSWSSWRSDRLDDALQRLRSVDIAMPMQFIEDRVRAELKAARRSSTEGSWGEDGVGRSTPSARKRARDAIGRAFNLASDKLSDLDPFFDDDDPDSDLKASLFSGFSQVLDTTMDLVAEVTSATVATRAKEEVEAAIATMTEMVHRAEAVLGSRHSWYEAYGAIVASQRSTPSSGTGRTGSTTSRIDGSGTR